MSSTPDLAHDFALGYMPINQSALAIYILNRLHRKWMMRPHSNKSIVHSSTSRVPQLFGIPSMLEWHLAYLAGLMLALRGPGHPVFVLRAHRTVTCRGRMPERGKRVSVRVCSGPGRARGMDHPSADTVGRTGKLDSA